MTILDTLITNRTQADVNKIKNLRVKIARGTATTDELNEYLYSPQPGAYGVSDLNRVGEAVEYLSAWLLEYGIVAKVTPKKNWALTDIPTDAELQTYLSNIRAIRQAITFPSDFVATPTSMRNLTFTQANAIESVLKQAEKLINNMIAEFRHTGTAFAFSGFQGVIL